MGKLKLYGTICRLRWGCVRKYGGFVGVLRNKQAICGACGRVLEKRMQKILTMWRMCERT